MVQAGQFLERATLIEVRGLCLEGLWHRGERSPALLVCPPHPRRGASMDSPVCAELAFAASRSGRATLRFNYRGAGASQGALCDDLPACVEDAAAALKVLRESASGAAVALAGYDFGASVALQLAKDEKDIAALALIAPLASAFDEAMLSRLAWPTIVVVGSRDTASGLDVREVEPPGCRRLVIEDADHGFSSGLSALGQAVARFLDEPQVARAAVARP